MAGDHFKMLYQGQPGDSTPELLYTVPTNYAAIMKYGEIVNIGTDIDALTIWLVPTGETPGDEWIWRPLTEVPPGQTVPFRGSMCVEAGYKVYGQSITGGILNFLLSGMEVDETAA